MRPSALNAKVGQASWIERRLLVIFIAIVLFLAALAGLTYRAAVLQRGASSSVVVTWEVLGELERVLSLLKDVETGQRGYLLTGREEFLEPYEEALPHIGLQLRELERLVVDEPVQQQRLAELKATVDLKTDFVAQSIAMQKAGSHAEAAAAITGGRGKVLMDEIRSISNQMRQHERRLLSDRLDAAERARDWLDRAFAVTGIFMGGVLLLAGSFMRAHFAQRRWAEEALEESEKRLRTAVSSLAEGFILQEASGQVYLSNASARKLLGEVANEDRRRLGFPPSLETARLALESATPQNSERRIEDPDGQQRVYAFSSVPLIRDGERVPYAVASTITDISERRRLAEVQARLAAFFMANPSPIAELDSDGDVVAMNDAAKRLVARENKTRLEELMPDDLATLVTDASGRKSTEVQVGSRTLDWSFFVIGDAVYAHGVDITSRVEAEVRLRQEQRAAVLSKLAAGLGHAFNNILTSITGNTELLRNTVGASEYIGAIESAAARAAALTKQLLSVAQRRMLQPRTRDLTSLTAGNLAVLNENLPGVEVLWQPSRLMRAQVDDDAYRDLLHDLAAFFRPLLAPRSRLEVSTRHPQAGQDRFATLVFRAPSVVLSGEEISQALDPLHDVEETAQFSAGLATVQGVMAQLGGECIVSSNHDAGTTVELLFRLPPQQPPLPKPPVRVNHTARRTVLIVEDEPEVRQLLQNALGVAGYEVLLASDGDEGLRVWHEARDSIAGILTDIVMPNLSGVEMARRIAEHGGNVPVIFMSGYSREIVDENFVIPEQVRFLPKPFRLAELFEALHEALEDGQGHRSASESPLNKGAPSAPRR